jgi:hypothetical protein
MGDKDLLPMRSALIGTIIMPDRMGDQSRSPWC